MEQHNMFQQYDAAVDLFGMLMILRSRNDGTILDDYAYHCDRNLGPFSHRSGVGDSTFFFVVRRVLLVETF